MAGLRRPSNNLRRWRTSRPPPACRHSYPGVRLSHGGDQGATRRKLISYWSESDKERTKSRELTVFRVRQHTQFGTYSSAAKSKGRYPPNDGFKEIKKSPRKKKEASSSFTRCFIVLSVLFRRPAVVRCQVALVSALSRLHAT